MSTEYTVRLDRSACEGVFACLVHDDRFEEADDGLATFDRAPLADTQEVACSDEALVAARRAASACPFDAIEVKRDTHD